MIRDMIRVLKVLREEYPKLYRRYCLLSKKERAIIMRDLMESKTRDDIRAVLMDINIKFERKFEKIRKLAA
jgi:hypothetical protein